LQLLWERKDGFHTRNDDDADDIGIGIVVAAVAEPLPNDLVVSALAVVMPVPVQHSSAAVFVVVAAVALSSVSFPTENSLVDNRLRKLFHQPESLCFPKEHYCLLR